MEPALEVIISAFASFIFITFIVAIVVLCKNRNSKRNPNATARCISKPSPAAVSKALDESASFDPSVPRISMLELLAATSNFAAEGIIGDGSFGFVYKAELSNSVKVAVKKLSREAFQGFREFRAEMETLGGIRHPNLVKMLGYCACGEDRVLIYEFVARGSLDQWLHDRSSCPSGSSQPLNWKIRKTIIKGVASGLCYLHEGCSPRIIHRDIKASNVLLDDEFGAHITDFGLARHMDGSHSHVSTQVAGTMGYMPPEYREGVTVATVKADVYSFGILMLELATGNRPNLPVKMKDGKEVGLMVWAHKMIEQGRYMDLIDPSMSLDQSHGHHDDDDEEKERSVLKDVDVMEYLKIAKKCTSERPKDRPTMGEVVSYLKTL